MPDTQALAPWQFLKLARLRAGYTSTAAAQALNVSLTHYCSVEAGRRGLSDEKLILAAKAFSVDVVRLEKSQPRLPIRARSAIAS